MADQTLPPEIPVDDAEVARLVYNVSPEELRRRDEAFKRNWRAASAAPQADPGRGAALGADPDDLLGQWAGRAPLRVSESLGAVFRALGGVGRGVEEAALRIGVRIETELMHAADDFASAWGWVSRAWRWSSSPLRGHESPRSRIRGLEEIRKEGEGLAAEARENRPGRDLLAAMSGAAERSLALAARGEASGLPGLAAIRQAVQDNEKLLLRLERTRELRDRLGLQATVHAGRKLFEMERARRITVLLDEAFGSVEAGHRAYAKIAWLSRLEQQGRGEATGAAAKHALARDIHSLGATPGIYLLGRPLSARARTAWAARRELMKVNNGAPVTGFEIEETFKAEALHERLKAQHAAQDQTVREAAPLVGRLRHAIEALKAVERDMLVRREAERLGVLGRDAPADRGAVPPSRSDPPGLVSEDGGPHVRPASSGPREAAGETAAAGVAAGENVVQFPRRAAGVGSRGGEDGAR